MSRGWPLRSYTNAWVANKQTHTKPFQPFLGVGWDLGKPHPTHPNYFVGGLCSFGTGTLFFIEIIVFIVFNPTFRMINSPVKKIRTETPKSPMMSTRKNNQRWPEGPAATA